MTDVITGFEQHGNSCDRRARQNRKISSTLARPATSTGVDLSIGFSRFLDDCHPVILLWR
jgi:hypothetical protein